MDGSLRVKKTTSVQFFKGCILQILLGPVVNTCFMYCVHMRPQSKTTYGSDKLVHCTS